MGYRGAPPPSSPPNYLSSSPWGGALLPLLPLLLLLLPTPAHSTPQVHSLYWNSSSAIFHSPAPLVVNMQGDTYTFDQAHIICPSEGEGREAYRVYTVSRAEFDSCHLCSPAPRLLADCSSPGRVTISFRRFSPLPGGLEFRPGSSHYLLSILDSPSTLPECTRNLRLLVRVGAGSEEQQVEGVTVNKPRRQLQTRVEEGRRVVYQRDTLSLSVLSRAEGREGEGSLLAALVSEAALARPSCTLLTLTLLLALLTVR